MKFTKNFILLALISSLVLQISCSKKAEDKAFPETVLPAIPSTPWLTQLGTVDSDYCHDVAVDKEGYVYCAGETLGDIGETNAGSMDVFVMKLNPSGTISWIKQFGSISNDRCDDVAVDEDGFVYCAGYTHGNLGGETNAGFRDAFVVKLTPDGEISWITQLGSTTTVPGQTPDATQYDACYGVYVDKNGFVYCTGETTGDLGGVSNGSNDAFLMKLTSTGEISWLKQFGSTGDDYSYNLVVDDNGNIYMAGEANGVIGQSQIGGYDAFVAKFTSAGVVSWIKQFGTGTDDVCYGVAIDNDQNVYCAGYTDGVLGQVNAGSVDAFITKLTSAGVISWVRQFGSSADDYCNDLAVDSYNNTYCAGETSGTLGATQAGMRDSFVVKVDPDGVVDWITQRGTTGDDYCNGVAVDRSNNIYCAGQTTGDLGKVNAGAIDAFIMKLNPLGEFE